MRITVIATVLLLLLQSRPLLAQVTPNTWFFELDGDYGSIIIDRGGDGIKEVTDGIAPARYSSWARKDSASAKNWIHVKQVLVRPYRRRPSDSRLVFPYMGSNMYEVRCDSNQPGPYELDRRNEQMILNHWTAGADSRRYFTFAFMMALAPSIGQRTYITQWHQDGNHQPPIRLSWNNDAGVNNLQFGLWHDEIDDTHRVVERFHSLGDSIPASLGVWYRFVVQVTPGWNGQVVIHQMDDLTGLWVFFASYTGPVGFLFEKGWKEGMPFDLLTGEDLEYQWKVGQYVNEVDRLRIYYDNVAYGKRWTQVTENRLTGYHKTVLDLGFDEGYGQFVRDRSYLRNQGQPGDPVKDYDNDGVIQGARQWNRNGVVRGSLHFDGTNYVTVPMDNTDFDFGNYVTVSVWFRTTNHPTENKGLVFINEYAKNWKVKLYMSDTGLLFGVRHPDWTYSLVNYPFTAGRYADGKWHHVVGTFNRFSRDLRVKLYVDGKRRAVTAGYDKPMLRGDSRLVVGKFSVSGLFVGDIDEVLVRNYAMTYADVIGLYAAYAR